MTVTLGGKRLSEFGVRVLRGSQMPALPQTRDRTLEIPGRHGLYDFGADLGPRPFELVCGIIEKSGYNVQQRIRDLAAHLLDQYGRPKIMDLIYDIEPDKVYRARYAGSVPVDRLFRVGQFTIPMIAYDPFAYLTLDVNDINIDSPVSVDNPISLDAAFSFSVSAPQTIDIDNFGTQAAEPTIEVTGSFTTLTLRIDEQEFTYTAPLVNETLLLDSPNYTAKIGTTNVLGNVSGDFLSLPVGAIPVQIDGTDLNCTITFRFKPKFI